MEPYRHCTCGHTRDVHAPNCAHTDCGCRAFKECDCGATQEQR